MIVPGLVICNYQPAFISSIEEKRGQVTPAPESIMLPMMENGHALSIHKTLKCGGVWVRLEGSIEQVTKADQSGEDAIAEQEDTLRALSAAEIEQ